MSWPRFRALTARRILQLPPGGRLGLADGSGLVRFAAGWVWVGPDGRRVGRALGAQRALDVYMAELGRLAQRLGRELERTAAAARAALARMKGEEFEQWCNVEGPGGPPVFGAGPGPEGPAAADAGTD